MLADFPIDNSSGTSQGDFGAKKACGALAQVAGPEGLMDFEEIIGEFHKLIVGRCLKMYTL